MSLLIVFFLFFFTSLPTGREDASIQNAQDLLDFLLKLCKEMSQKAFGIITGLKDSHS